MSYRQYDSFRGNQTHQSFQERSGLNVHQPSANYFPTHRNIDSQEHTLKRNSFPNNQMKKNQLKSKIKEIIDLCKDQNATVTSDIAGVSEAEKGLYHMLQQANFQGDGAQPQPQPTPTSFNPNPNPVNYTPIRNQPEEAHPGRAMQQDIRNLLSQNPNVQLNQEAIQLINQIQRRCLEQIQKIRDEKLSLIGQLNEQIKQHNAQKRRSAQLQKQLSFYQRNPAPGAHGGDGKYEQELKDRVVFLEGMLQNAQQQQPQGMTQILFEQGEALRQETLRLLKIKQTKSNTDDHEKRQLRDEIDSLQRKLEFYQQQRLSRPSKPSYQVINEQYSPIAANHKRKDSYRNSANEYQSLVMQMRKITNN